MKGRLSIGGTAVGVVIIVVGGILAWVWLGESDLGESPVDEAAGTEELGDEQEGDIND